MDIRSSVAARQYANMRPATAAKPAPDTSAGLSRAVENFEQTLKNGEQKAMGAMSGGADPQALVMALTQTELAVETAVTVRDKVVEAYQEILRMPV